ncbi:BTB/POZ and MATH domain-containing protein 1-like [Hordeum vulgare subsp. vulgare]|uniref:BTB/POZ and MATH domain-containing protein 1-like n=1 Tax=Hordeum vulgare subsp. vulgare TaxID=112509 RepID=UPI001D1A4161|nr:BTB/POZ and MATH domain-containing protein 1-like [Hordeum vulgare subsp. vulgare]
MSVAGSPDAGTRPMRSVYMALKIPATTAIGDRNQAYIAARRFAVLGYEWQIDYHPNSHYPYHRRRGWVKLRITLVGTPSPDAGAVTASFTFCLVDLRRTLRPLWEVATHCPRFRQGSSEEVMLVSRAALEASGYIGRDDNFFVQCKAPYAGDKAVVVHPGDLSHDLDHLLQSENGADVTFVVGVESFRAHRCVLAARSPVFAAELAGSLMDEEHEVKDTDADAFRALLRFIYTDALPPQLEEMELRKRTRKPEGDQKAVSMARRLLEAADRYGVERLKVICEEKVCSSVGVGTVAEDLVLAERRGYKKLKDRCMEFLVASPADMLTVAAAGGCKLLEATCPSVLTEILTAVAARSCRLALGGGTHS